MPLVASFYSLSPAFAYGEHQSSDMETLSLPWPEDWSLVGPLSGVAPRTTHHPVEFVPRVRVGFHVGRFSEDYYHRVHVAPSHISLGNLLSSQTRNVEVWNAHFESKVLSAIGEEGLDGITLTAPAAAPTTFAPLESRIYVVSISTDGAPVIDGTYSFFFTGETPLLRIGGRRVVVWPFLPQTQHNESLEWSTDVLPSFKSEQRLALRTAPRQGFALTHQLDPNQFSRAKAMATQWAARVYGLPVWSELTRVGGLTAGAATIMMSTADADYRDNDVVCVWESDSLYEAVEITTVLADRLVLKLPLPTSFTNALVLPLRFARTLDGVDFNRGASDITVAQVSFNVSQNKDLGGTMGLPQYRGKDVLTIQTSLQEEAKERISRIVTVFDNGSGPVDVDVNNNWVRSSKIIAFDTLDRSERWSTRKWLHSLRGRQKSFWLPSWTEDLTPVVDLTTAIPSIVVRYLGYHLFYTVKDVVIMLRNGTYVYARITGGSVNPDGSETLALSAPLPQNIAMADIDRVCFMSHVRLDTDKINLRHSYAGRMSTTISVVETPE